MTDDMHTCSYHCDRPECIRAQRDELRDELAKLRARIAEAPVATLLHGNGELLVAVSAEDPDDWAGKAVRLLVEDEG